MDAQTYWKFRFNIERIERMKDQVERSRILAYTEAGLDPNKNYRINDEICEIVDETPITDIKE